MAKTEIPLEFQVSAYMKILEIRAKVLRESVADYESDDRSEALQFLIDKKKEALRAVTEIISEMKEMFGTA